MKYRILFRTCDKVFSVHQVGRPFGLNKQEVIKLCFKSLLGALEGFEYSIHVIADNLSPEMDAFFVQHNAEMIRGVFGNDESIRQSLKRGLAFDDEDWVYFCEDDYLHDPNCFKYIDDLLNNAGKVLLTKLRYRLRKNVPVIPKSWLKDPPLIIHTPDYPDRYRPKDRKPSLLFISNYCHWRQIVNTTFTFMAEAKTLRQFQSAIETSAKGANDGYLSDHVYARRSFIGKALAISPIPGLATHMHDGVMTPLVDWQKIYEMYKEKEHAL